MRNQDAATSLALRQIPRCTCGDNFYPETCAVHPPKPTPATYHPALTNAVNRAIAEGSPIYVCQPPEKPKTHTEAINEATGWGQPYKVLSFTLNREPLPVADYRHDAPFIEGDTRVIQYSDGATIPQVFQGTTAIGGWYDEDEYDEAPDADEKAIEQAAEGIASGQPFTLEEGEKQMHVSPASGQNHPDLTCAFCHRSTVGGCACY